MKNELDIYKLNVWTWIMLVCFVVGGVGLIPMASAFGLPGLIPSAVLILVVLAASFVLERIKKKYNLGTYAEVVAFFDGTPADKERVAKEMRHGKRSFVLKIAGGVGAGLLIVSVGVLIEKLFM